MNLKKKLNELRGTILGLEMEMNLLEHDLNRIEVDLFYLDKLQRDLTYNINLLKRDDIVAVLPEYRKSVSALKEVRGNIIKFNNLRQKIQKSIDTKLKQYDFYFNEFEKEYSGETILPFKGK